MVGLVGAPLRGKFGLNLVDVDGRMTWKASEHSVITTETDGRRQGQTRFLNYLRCGLSSQRTP